MPVNRCGFRQWPEASGQNPKEYGYATSCRSPHEVHVNYQSICGTTSFLVYGNETTARNYGRHFFG